MQTCILAICVGMHARRSISAICSMHIDEMHVSGAEHAKKHFTSHHITSHHITSHHITHTHTQSKRGRKIAHTYMTHISMYMHTYRCLSSSISSMFMTANHFLTILLCSQLQFIMLHASNQEKVLIYIAHFKPYCVVCAFLEFVHCSATFVCVCV
jgi:hypothetical protein